MLQVQNVTGHPGGECYLILLDHCAILWDTGFGFCADRMVWNLEQALAGRTLDAVLLSHSHYDHVLGVTAVKRRFPDAKVIASERTAQILTKQGARATMQELDNSAAAMAGNSVSATAAAGLAVDTALGDDAVITVGGVDIHAIAAPGHTKCCMHYYFPQHSLLAACESVGVAPYYPEIICGMIVSYRDTLRAISAGARLKAQRLMLSHTGLIDADDTPMFFQRAASEVEKVVDYIRGLHNRHIPTEQMVEMYKAAFYSEAQAKIQPESAFMLNAQAMIPRLIAELENAES